MSSFTAMQRSLFKRFRETLMDSAVFNATNTGSIDDSECKTKYLMLQPF